MPVQKLQDFLDGQGVRYLTIRHSPAYTAQEIAALAHVPGREMAKTVMIHHRGRMAMAVLPASRRIDVEHLREALGAEDVRLAEEHEFRELFPGCETGAMPPIGNLYGLEVFVDRSLTEDEQIAFNAGTHHELVQMAYADYERLVRPKVFDFATQPA